MDLIKSVSRFFKTVLTEKSVGRLEDLLPNVTSGTPMPDQFKRRFLELKRDADANEFLHGGFRKSPSITTPGTETFDLEASVTKAIAKYNAPYEKLFQERLKASWPEKVTFRQFSVISGEAELDVIDRLIRLGLIRKITSNMRLTFKGLQMAEEVTHSTILWDSTKLWEAYYA